MSDQSEEFQAKSAEYPPLDLQPVHYFYAAVLSFIYILNFYIGGLILAFPVLIFWAFVFTSRNRPRSLGIACGIVCVGSILLIIDWNISFLIYLLAIYISYFYAYRYHQTAILIGIGVFLLNLILFYLLLPTTVSYRESNRYTQCRNNLKQLGLALHNYHDEYGSFPPAYVADENGKPMHSWRVLLLPYIDQKSLYDKYQFDEPWDGPNNSQLLKEFSGYLNIYQCPSDVTDEENQGFVSYLAVVDDRTAWPGAEARAIKEFSDGASNTILLIEAHTQGIHWMEPRDLTLKEAIDYLTTTDEDVIYPHPKDERYYKKASQCHYLLSDGKVSALTHGGDRKLIESLILLYDGLPKRDWYKAISPDQLRRLRLEVIFGLVLVLLITLWPLPWVWIKPRSA